MEVQNSTLFNNLTFPLPFIFIEDETTCPYNVSYGLSKNRSIYTIVEDNLINVTNESLTVYPGVLKV